MSTALCESNDKWSSNFKPNNSQPRLQKNSHLLRSLNVQLVKKYEFYEDKIGHGSSELQPDYQKTSNVLLMFYKDEKSYQPFT